MTNALVSIQVIPTVAEDEDAYDYVDQAIQVIEEAGVKYEVHPLETTMEGDFTELMSIVQKMNELLVSKGAEKVISQIKVLYQPDGITADSLTGKYT